MNVCMYAHVIEILCILIMLIPRYGDILFVLLKIEPLLI